MTVQRTQDGRTPPIKVHVEVEGVSIPMEVDTGASVSIQKLNKCMTKRLLSRTLHECTNVIYKLYKLVLLLSLVKKLYCEKFTSEIFYW